MRRPVSLAAVAAALVAGGVLLAGCGSDGVKTASPDSVVGSVPQPTQTTTTTPNLPKGNPVDGKAIFTGSAGGCFGCHTLKAANAHGNIGPNLDQAKPELSLIIDRVTNGKGGMPPFKDRLKSQQIADVAAYVYQSTHGG